MASGRLRLHSPVQLLPAVISRWGYLQGSADVSDGLALAQKLLSGAQLADDLYSCGEAFGYGAVAFGFHRGFSLPSLAGGEALISIGSVYRVHATLNLSKFIQSKPACLIIDFELLSNH